MLNDTHKYLINEIMKFDFFDHLENLPAEIQLKACQAALSLTTFLEVKEELASHEGLVEQVKMIGELLTHPAPQNPSDTTLNILDEVAVNPIIIIVRSLTGAIGTFRRGRLNLSLKDTEGCEATQSEVTEYIKSLITEKIANKEEAPVEMKVEEIADVPEPISNFNVGEYILLKGDQIPAIAAATMGLADDSLIKLPIDVQIKILGMEINELNLSISDLDAKKLRDLKSFLDQFGVTINREALTEETKQKVISFHNRFKQQFNIVKDFVGENNAGTFDTIDILEAMLGRFSHFLSKNPSSFYTYKGLQRLALANGHLSMIPLLEPDYLDIAILLIKANKPEKLQEVLLKHGANFLPIYANFMVYICCQELSNVHIDIFTILLKHAPITNKYKINIITKLMSLPFTPEIAEALNILFYNINFRVSLPIDLCKKIYTQAIQDNNFELQVLVLLHSPKEFTARRFLTSKNFFDLIFGEHFQAAIKMAYMEFPGTLTIRDLEQALILSKGRLQFTNVSFAGNLSHLFIPQRQILTLYEQITPVPILPRPSAQQADPSQLPQNQERLGM